MNEAQRAEIEQIVLETMKRELPKLLGRSMVQVREHLIENIT
mgnify:CR=1 FL=1